MNIDRRLFTLSLASLGLSACSSGAQTVGRAALSADLQPQPNPAYDAWVANFRNRVSGISPATLNAAFANAGYLPGVITRDRNQIQTRRTLEDYLSIAVSDDRVAKGRSAYARYANILSAVQSRYGVDARIVCAIWGVESQYGEKKGDIPVISATSTLAFDGRRGAFYEDQLRAALRILENGDTSADQMKGSWAGAMGHTQFIPTSYQSFAVDFTGDGRRDIWSDDPSDSLASTAAYLSRNGWQNGLAWGSEEGTGGPAGRIVQPQAGGARFVVTRNFNVIKTYNNSDFYAIGVGHLADRIGGAGPLRGSFPPDENGLTKADRQALQRGLARRGYDVGSIDGVIGGGTERAIRAFQTQQGLPITGVPSRALLAALQ
ncbi:lytic murein transglycosylase [Cognatiyoonia koreensis]|uniref:Lytic murein transglycosylase n=1 Tax=Cognatiyoonia koreensis TaxID=364200 RepID=A0A1I0RHU4_9RHOB|nr:lytic murein transglycosylase [Cognatiyoonia koreensis]SEW40255.1 lytic murein transglycosylase [Cognatiyoonia koreensis]